jgi:hypothetical protein
MRAWVIGVCDTDPGLATTKDVCSQESYILGGVIAVVP